jgi:putative Holliday junction resolvase
MKILAVDPGLAKIGLAVSDATGTVARSLAVFPHTAPAADAERILAEADREHAEQILVGVPGEADASPVTRLAHQLLAGLRERSGLSVIPWDESFSTQTAAAARRERGDSRKARRRPDDALAAAAFLQEYLNEHSQAKC